MTNILVSNGSVFFRPNYGTQPNTVNEVVPSDAKKGLDVSSNQGKIDWIQVSKGGFQYAILRCVKRKGVDEQFEANYKGAKTQGIKVGAYIFSYAMNIQEAEADAVRVAEVLRGKTLDMPFFLDLE